MKIHHLQMGKNASHTQQLYGWHFSPSWFVWCQSRSHHYFCAKIIQNSKKIPDLFPLGKMLLLASRIDPQEELTLDPILREFFSPPIPKFAHSWQIRLFYQIFSHFGAQKVECCMAQLFRAALRGYAASKCSLLVALLMPIYSKNVYFLAPKAILRLHTSSGD